MFSLLKRRMLVNTGSFRTKMCKNEELVCPSRFLSRFYQDEPMVVGLELFR